MTTVEAAAVGVARRGTFDTFVALFRVVLRTQLSIPRLLGIGALSALAVAIGLFARFDANPDQAAADAVASYGLGILVPLATLWLGTSALGDLVEDRLLVYLWLKPVPRWQLPGAAVLATVAVVVPLTALPLTASALVAGATGVAWPTFLAASLGALAYAGLFVAAGLWFRRAVWWGLAFIVVWENVVAHAAEGIARFTVLGWTASVLGLGSPGEEQLEAGSAAVAFVVLVAVAIVAWLAATRRYGRADVD
jgi:ABC-2 type transport system permease protein